MNSPFQSGDPPPLLTVSQLNRQVKSLLRHPQLQAGPAVLLGDMNAWRKCKGTQELDDVFERHHNQDWPSTFPAPAPVLALDRVYTHRAKVLSVESHDTPASRRASDHLPVIARIELPTPTEDETPPQSGL